jgi:demethylmenaquinone methyltransferase/2-methoxy-6-polyprenyl-1,4-benzoquinol methylase
MAAPAESPAALARQSPEAIAAMFGRVAPRYDLLNHLLCGGTDWYWRRRLMRAVAAQKPARALDVATGSGDVLLTLRRHRVYSQFAAGVDFCLPMLQRAREKKAPPLTAGDALKLPFADGSFDALTLAFGLRNFADREAGLREMRRLLRPGGCAYILEFSRPVEWFAPLYFWYLRHVMPKYARLFTPERGAYEYLAESIEAFPRPAELAAMLHRAGFAAAEWKRLTLGIVALHIGRV